MDSYRIGRGIVGGLGAAYVLVGLVGFVVTGFDGFAAREGERLLGIFEINPLHNIAHLGIGLALLASLRAAPIVAAAVAGTIGAVYALLAIVGPMVDDSRADILALNTADHFLHAVSALALLTAAYLLRKPATSAEPMRRPRAA